MNLKVELLAKKLEGLNVKFSDKEMAKLSKISDEGGRISK